MHSLPPALAPLGAWRQFIVWQLVPAIPKPDKVPLDWRSRRAANPHDPDIWLSADEAIHIAAQWGEGYGVGFVFTENDPFWFLDVDHALTDTGWSAVSAQLATVLGGCAIEISTSGKGFHMFGTGRIPPHGCRNKAFGLELYHTGRFVALTGRSAAGNAAVDATAQLEWLVSAYFMRGSAGVEFDEISAVPMNGWVGPADNAELLRRAMQSKSTRSLFGETASFADLWTGNASVLSKVYPPDKATDPFNRSNVDMALMQHLAFWTGKHGTRMLDLMWQSQLVRPKWTDHATYLRDTCLTALSRQLDVLMDKPVEPVAAAPSAGPLVAVKGTQREVTGSTFLTPAQQAEIFAGCCYVTDSHAILVPGGELLDQGRFKVRYGGYSFAMDTRNERVVRNAWEAYTESQALRPVIAETTCFKPNLDPMVIIDGAVNQWWPLPIARSSGNPKPFLDHLGRLLPDVGDQHVLLSYLAACVQHKGVKFQWAPLLQGVEGNGKTFFSYAVMQAVGMRYAHIPRPRDISSQFNPWLRNKLVIAIEDVYAEHDKVEVFEMLKPMITGRYQAVEPKGVDQKLAEIVANFIFNSNHKDGVRKTPNDRRIAPLFCKQQTKDDLASAGMNREYFQSLYGWYEHGGMAVVNEFLASWPIPDELNPAHGGIAPLTTSTAEAIGASLGTIEQHVAEAIAQGVIGFMGGWVSSIYLDRFLEEKNLARRVPPQKRRALLQALGYDVHGGLPGGRVNNPVLPDNGKPVLYIKNGHAASHLTGADVARAYNDAQMPRFGVAA